MSVNEILKLYQLKEGVVDSLGNGLINYTFLVQSGDGKFVIQKINTYVFQNPQAIAHNINAISKHLHQYAPEYLFVQPLIAVNGAAMIEAGDGSYWRIFPFVNNSKTIDVVTSEEQAYEAARQFGLFAKKLHAFDVRQLQITIPHFHDLNFRVQQFEEAIQNGREQRKELSATVINELKKRTSLVALFNKRIADGSWKQRVMHHDTKISNVLFDEKDKAICVIDLDTIMPGYFFSDAGDMMRTYLSPVKEEDTDFSEITVRDAFFYSIVKGYVEAMQDELTVQEKKDFVLAGKLMIFMQSLRFITDFLNDDVYYGANYELHNYNRAINQLELLKRVEAKEEAWTKWLDEYINL